MGKGRATDLEGPGGVGAGCSVALSGEEEQKRVGIEKEKEKGGFVRRKRGEKRRRGRNDNDQFLGSFSQGPKQDRRKSPPKGARGMAGQPPAGFKHKPTDNLQRWVIEVLGAPGTLYANETYQLQVDFPEHYPMEAPQVIFLHPAPLHPHIYSNGHICLDILYDSWSQQ
uniref:UBC core domain-containing protein n=1 Tax=Ananas comosus var. bracteatus TaxID=296719 RepID=A0A6V7QRT5_ANACO